VGTPSPSVSFSKGFVRRVFTLLSVRQLIPSVSRFRIRSPRNSEIGQAEIGIVHAPRYSD
jgi:hypothetical protein